METLTDELLDTENLPSTSIEQAVTEYLSLSEIEASGIILTTTEIPEKYIKHLRLCDMKTIANDFKLPDYRNISKRNLTRAKMTKIITQNWASVGQYVIGYIETMKSKQLEENRKLVDIRDQVRRIVLWNRYLKQGDEVDMHIAIQQPAMLTSNWKAWYKSYTVKGHIEFKKGELISVKVSKTEGLPPQIADYYSFTWQSKKGNKRGGYSIPGFNSVSIRNGIARVVCPLESSDLLQEFYKW